MEEEVITSYRSLDELGKGMHEVLVIKRLMKCSAPYSDTIHRNSFYTFSNRPDVKSSKPDKYKALKQSTVLVTQMFLSLQSRPNPDENIKDFMSHENCREPPLLSERGMLRFGNKSDILDCLGAHKGLLSEVK